MNKNELIKKAIWQEIYNLRNQITYINYKLNTYPNLSNKYKLKQAQNKLEITNQIQEYKMIIQELNGEKIEDENI